MAALTAAPDSPAATALDASKLTLAHAQALDAADPLRPLRSEFLFPPLHDGAADEVNGDKEVVYLCGNSLGLQSRETRRLVIEELDVWNVKGVEGHFDHPHARPWVAIDETVNQQLARIVGALPTEVAAMNTLTSNLHLALVSFYRPTAQRHKILIEEKAFPSDHYAMESQIRFHGFDPATSLLLMKPRQGEQTLRTEDILSTIEQEGDSIALICFSGVQYYTGQLFDIPTITAAGHKKGCTVGFDLAHAAGNVPLKLHDWNVDFAVWCTYKYLNSGPGGIAGLFIHQKWDGKDLPKFTGWWGHEKASRFLMNNEFKPVPGAYGYQLSNPSVLTTVALLGSLNIFERTSMEALREKSRTLTGYLEQLLDTVFGVGPDAPVSIITPRNPDERGCQLSLMFKAKNAREIYQRLVAVGVICDKREPDVIRVSPAPIYNSFVDVYKFVYYLRRIVS